MTILKQYLFEIFARNPKKFLRLCNASSIQIPIINIANLWVILFEKQITKEAKLVYSYPHDLFLVHYVSFTFYSYPTFARSQ